MNKKNIVMWKKNMFLKINLISFYTIVRKEWIRIIRIWIQTLLPPVITIMLYFTIFGKLIGQRIGTIDGFSYIHYIIPGLIMMTIIQNAYSNVVSSFFSAKFQGNIEELLISPTKNSVIIVGYVFGGAIRGLIIGFLITMISLYFSKLAIKNIMITTLVALLSSILFALAGMINGILAKKFDDISLIPTFVLNPLIYLGGVFYSTSLLNDFFKNIIYFNPIFYIINAFRYGIIGSTDVNINISLVIMVVLIFVLFFITLSIFKKKIVMKN
jgi:ABC-2 type transport system permease protein